MFEKFGLLTSNSWRKVQSKICVTAIDSLFQNLTFFDLWPLNGRSDFVHLEHVDTFIFGIRKNLFFSAYCVDKFDLLTPLMTFDPD